MTPTNPRTITERVTGRPTTDGAGVHLVRVLANTTAETFDPFLMLDSFDTDDYDAYKAGFPMHPHRGIETISYVYKGAMTHHDSLGNTDTVTDGEVQWMTAGSGIMHEEQLPSKDGMLGVQLWLNMPANDKMAPPAYHAVKRDDIPEVPVDGGMVRVLAGDWGETSGYHGKYVALDYYDVHLEADAELTVPVRDDATVMLFTLKGDAVIAGEAIREKTAVRTSDGDSVTLKGAPTGSQILLMAARPLRESIAWGGPIVMNTRAELMHAFEELDRGTFIKDNLEIE